MKISIEKRRVYLLIALCWLVYTCSYIGKLSYNANIVQIGPAFGVTKDECGMVSSFFFFAYGIGQVVNGMMCKRYNIKYVIYGALTVASVMNLLIPFVTSFALVKYIWLINGIAMSFLWTSLIRLLSETLHDEDMNMAIIAMGTTVATGTFIVYGMSALFSAVASYHLTFIVAGSAMLIISLVWLFSFSRLTEVEKRDSHEATEHPVHIPEKTQHKTVVLISVLAFFAVANNFVKDGLTAWTPDILKNTYATPDWLSILLTLLLPTLGILGTVVAVNLQKKTHNFVGSVTLLFIASTVLTFVVLAMVSSASHLAVTVGIFGIVSCLMGGVNNIITSMVPLSLKAEGNSGKIAGILNGFCYLGSTISSYGLGLIAEKFDWMAVFVTLIGVGIFVITIGCIYIIHNKIKRGANR
jgi:OPA family glycerol-3-phosphate transporter-like MFS transporter